MKEKLNKCKTPPCVYEEVNFCRGCPGWSFMIKAQKEGNGLWKNIPVHCSVTGITVYSSIENKK